MWEELNQDIKPYHLAPLLSAAIFIMAMMADRSEPLLTVLFFLNILALPFLTGVLYVCSHADASQVGWKNVILGAWPTVLLIVLVNLLLGNFGGAVIFVAPFLLFMASLGGILAQFIRLNWGLTS